MSQQDDVLILGAGIIGIACAHYLNKAGFRVTVVDRGPVAGACSQSNCGYICPSHVLPLTEPGTVKTALKSLFNPSAAFRVKPTLNPALWLWMIRFARRCNHEDMMQAGHALQTLLEASMDGYRDLIQKHQLDCRWRNDGLLYAFRSPDAMAAFARSDALLSKEFGVKARHLDAHELSALDPGFCTDLAGAFLYENDASVTPEKLNQSWRTLLEKQGVRFIEHCSVTAFQKEGNQITGVLTQQGLLQASRVVFALGAWSAHWAKQLGCRLPVQPGKGYSITMDDPKATLSLPTLFPECRVGVTPMDGAIRFGSMMEFNGYDNSLDPKRLQLLRDGANAYLAQPVTAPVREAWSGWRPMTYDSLPIIGFAPGLSNLMLATGHNMIGLTLAAATGRLVAELVSGTRPHIDPAPYGPERFL